MSPFPEIALRDAFREIEELKNQLEAESVYLQHEIKLDHNFDQIIGQSEALKYVLNRVEKVAPTASPVLILGETGTGKELIARAIHQLSPLRVGFSADLSLQDIEKPTLLFSIAL